MKTERVKPRSLNAEDSLRHHHEKASSGFTLETQSGRNKFSRGWKATRSTFKKRKEEKREEEREKRRKEGKEEGREEL